jgi:hypothetical protein
MRDVLQRATPYVRYIYIRIPEIVYHIYTCTIGLELNYKKFVFMGRIFLQVFWIDKDYYKLGVFLFFDWDYTQSIESRMPTTLTSRNSWHPQKNRFIKTNFLLFCFVILFCIERWCGKKKPCKWTMSLHCWGNARVILFSLLGIACAGAHHC